MKGMVLTMKIFAIELIFNGGRTENAVYACAAYDETISIPEKKRCNGCGSWQHRKRCNQKPSECAD